MAHFHKLDQKGEDKGEVEGISYGFCSAPHVLDDGRVIRAVDIHPDNNDPDITTYIEIKK